MKKITQQSVASLPESQQDAAMSAVDRATVDYPSVRVEGCSIHVCEMGGPGGDWEVWLNNEDHDFTGLCLSVGKTRDKAVADAVTALQAAVERLQGPPWH